MTKVLSFDIDGVLDIGEPPGPITLAMVRRAVELGYTVGSCSDRPGGLQRSMWEGLGIPAQFTVQKHQLDRAHDQFPDAESYEHVGVADRDAHYSELGGFEFVQAYQADGQPWTRDASGAVLAANEERLSVTEQARISGNAG